MYGCESWTIKKAKHRRIDAFELWCWRSLLRVPWTARRSHQSIPKAYQSWILIGRTNAEAETPILWPPDGKYWLIWKDPDAGKDWGQEEKGTTEDEMVGWHHRLNGHGFGWTPGAGDGRGGLVCCGSWGRKELGTTEWLNWTECSTFTASFFRSLKQLNWNSITSISFVRAYPAVAGRDLPLSHLRSPLTHTLVPIIYLE